MHDLIEIFQAKEESVQKESEEESKEENGTSQEKEENVNQNATESTGIQENSSSRIYCSKHFT